MKQLVILIMLGGLLNFQELPAQINANHHQPQKFEWTLKNGSSRNNLSPSATIYKTIATPILLVGAGVYAMSGNDLLNRTEIKEERDELLPTFRHRADDYLQYLPIAAVYGLNAVGIKGKNSFGDRTALLLKYELIMVAMTYSLKKLTAVPRPDTGQLTSFPSGHTAQAFAAATFMVKEYGHKNVLFSIGAYTIAGGIGVMRVMNNRHWISDVLAGAGIGILSTNLAYLTHQYQWNKKKKSPSLILPSYDGRTGMITVVHQF